MENQKREGWPYPGSRWWKFDLHTHTPASEDYADQDATPSKWLLGFMRAGVDCVAVTDHNSGEWIDKLKSELSKLEKTQPPGFRYLHLFPGVELSVNSGFHLLAILDPSATSSSVDELLGAVNYDGTRGKSDGVTRESAVSVVAAIVEAGGIPIPAHADRRKGLLRSVKSNGRRSTEIDSNTVKQVLDCDRILAMETIDSDWMKPHVFLERKIRWTEVLGSDSHCLNDNSRKRLPGSRYTWFKMAKPPSIEGLRLALLDGKGCSVIRSDARHFEPFATPNHFVDSIEIKNARYMGRPEPTVLRFSPMLNAIVGGRGTGKSTVVHALRLAAGRESEIRSLKEGSVPRSTFESFNNVPRNRYESGALTDQTSIRWTVMRDGIRHRVTWRTNGADLTVEEQVDNRWMSSCSQSVTPERFPIRILSQGQIAELTTGSQPALLHLVDESADMSVPTSRLTEAQSRYYTARTRIRELEQQIRQKDDLSVQLQDVERKLSHLEASDHSEVLRAYRQRTRQQKEVSQRFKWIDQVARKIDRLLVDIQLDDLPDGLLDESDPADRPYRKVMNTLESALEDATTVFQNEAEKLRDTSNGQRLMLDKGLWQEAADEATAMYDKSVHQLRNAGIDDPREYALLIQERQKLRRDLNILESKQRELSRQIDESVERLQEVQEARSAISNAREMFLSNTLDTNQFVRIFVQRYGHNAREIEQSLRSVLGVEDSRFETDILTIDDGQPKVGIVADLLRNLSTNDPQRDSVLIRRLNSLKRQLDSACHGEKQFGGRFNNYLKKQFDRDPTLLDRLWVWFPEDSLNVKYSRAGDGNDFKPISQASAGQKSATLVAFILTHGTEPLLLDQPEDDLDNRLIYDLVVRQIRRGKLSRQIIVVTHNPNIVINGDAEFLHVMKFASRKGQCVVSASGSLEEELIRQDVCQVMEGGREAFQLRYRRLKMESPDV